LDAAEPWGLTLDAVPGAAFRAVTDGLAWLRIPGCPLSGPSDKGRRPRRCGLAGLVAGATTWAPGWFRGQSPGMFGGGVDPAFQRRTVRPRRLHEDHVFIGLPVKSISRT